MKLLIERQRSRIARKAEDALANGVSFDASRAGVGEVHPKHADAAAINKAADAAIARTVAIIGAAPARIAPSAITSVGVQKIKLGGI